MEDMMRFREVETYETGQRRYRRIELPTIVCLLGSTSFYEEYQRIAYQETMAGKIVLSGPAYEGHTACPPEWKRMLDELQLRKIDLADEVFVINVKGYVGESTMNGIAYALWRRKRLRWLEEPVGGTDAWVLEHKQVLGKFIAKHLGFTPIDDEQTITLDSDIEGLGKAGDKIPIRVLMGWGAAQGFELGYHRKEADEVPQPVAGRSPHVPEDDGEPDDD